MQCPCFPPECKCTWGCNLLLQLTFATFCCKKYVATTYFSDSLSQKVCSRYLLFTCCLIKACVATVYSSGSLSHVPELKPEIDIATQNDGATKGSASEGTQQPDSLAGVDVADPLTVVGNQIVLNKGGKGKTVAVIFGAIHKTNVDGNAGQESLPGGHSVQLNSKTRFKVTTSNDTYVSLKPIDTFWQTIASVSKTMKHSDQSMSDRGTSFAKAYSHGACCFLLTQLHTPQPKHPSAQSSPQLETLTTQHCTMRTARHSATI